MMICEQNDKRSFIFLSDFIAESRIASNNTSVNNTNTHTVCMCIYVYICYFHFIFLFLCSFGGCSAGLAFLVLIFYIRIHTYVRMYSM